ncbi:CopG family transcriptional regulator [Natrialbaceae archaeon AArc-T1-2]|uniref:CopG family transcriptional regulator n=1 Tax=Natrialbaceae archaeon AArc-T1-2 TaxID=3053904 RepID=UPI00255A7156|nr:CopG family transcriptional regulator [Natrialbaceae archaeon AArc-T1-2]WIV68580.1 CopG family transcriptional regulator [Natrialbaceae archaeon AArc-T1-2]
MGNKNKTISFRVNEKAFEALQDIAEERDISLSAVFRDYVDMLVEHDGRVEVVPETELEERRRDDGEPAFPPTVEVPKSFVREHERLELEAEHLREQLEEHKAYVADLRERLEDEEEVLLLDDLDDDEPYQVR